MELLGIASLINFDENSVQLIMIMIIVHHLTVLFDSMVLGGLINALEHISMVLLIAFVEFTGI